MFSKLFFGLAFIFTLITALPATAETPPAFKDKEYLAAVDAAIKAQGVADWKTIRQLYIESSFYDNARRHGMGGTLMSDFGRKAAETKTPEAIALYKENARKYAGAMDTHVEAFGLIEKYKPDFLDLAYSKAAFKGLLDALMATGDGRSMKTAFKVVSTSEEYILMRSVFRLTIRGKTLEQGNGEMFDIHKVSNAKGEDVGDIFFNISLFFGKMELPPDVEKKIEQFKREHTVPPGVKREPMPTPEDDVKYLALVDAAMKNPAQGNWSELRKLYPATSFYKRVGGTNIAHYAEEMTNFVAKRMTPEAIAVYRNFQREHYAAAGAHSRAVSLSKDRPAPFIDPKAEQAALDGIMNSLRASGDGKSHETAFKAVSLDEATYAVMPMFKSPPGMRVENDNNVPFLAFSGRNANDESIMVYFALDLRAITEPAQKPAPPAISRMTIEGTPAPSAPLKEPPLLDPRNPDASKVSYLILDLEGDGLKFDSLKANEGIYWDIDNDGFREATAWPHDAFLMIDLNDNGRVTNHAELFGMPGMNSYDVLAQKDDNKDGVIDKKDAIWPQLRVWLDANRSGNTDPGEMTTLADKKIYSIELKVNRERKMDNGTTLLSRGAFRMLDAAGKATVRDMAAVFLDYDDMNTVDQRGKRVDAKSFFLPQLQGYGVISSLTTAMSRDRTLMAQVQKISMISLGALVNDPVAYEKRMHEILFSWAGVATLDPASRGPNIDARRLKALEKLTGQKFAQIGAGGLDNPLFFAATSLNHAYTEMFNHVYGRIGAQVFATQIFAGKIYYDPRSDKLANVTGLNIPALAELSALIVKNPDPLRRREAWKGIMRIISVVDKAKLPPEDLQALDSLMKQSDASFDYAAMEGFIKAEDIRTLPGHDYVAKKLGLSGKDGDIVEVIELARAKDASQQIVYSDLATEILRACCKTEQEIVDYLTAHNFKIGVYPIEAARRETGTNFAYTRVLKAVRQPTVMENLGTKFGSNPPPEFNIVFVYMNGSKFEWAYGHIQK